MPRHIFEKGNKYGRPKGSKSKANHGLIFAEGQKTPGEILIKLMNDPGVKADVRARAAAALLPYVYRTLPPEKEEQQAGELEVKTVDGVTITVWRTGGG